jgi:uncharacterized protein YjbJ (UPF0337 family)
LHPGSIALTWRDHKPDARARRETVTREQPARKENRSWIVSLRRRSLSYRIAPPVIGFSEAVMDKDRIEGAATNLGGKAKETAGNVTGDQKLKSEGVVDQIKGKLQNAIGGLKDLFRRR